jgi:hypothetical protein
VPLGGDESPKLVEYSKVRFLVLPLVWLRISARISASGHYARLAKWPNASRLHRDIHRFEFCTVYSILMSILPLICTMYKWKNKVVIIEDASSNYLQVGAVTGSLYQVKLDDGTETLVAEEDVALAPVTTGDEVTTDELLLSVA